MTKEKFYAYRRVQLIGKFNMFTPEALKATGLDKEDFFDIIDNYSIYMDQYFDKELEDKIAKEILQ